MSSTTPRLTPHTQQLLHKHVQNVAWAFPQGPIRDRYIAAAQDFRIPYWDWAVLLDDATRPIPTYIAEDEEIAITATDGTQQFVQNPLHHFEFHPCEPVPGSFEGKV
jgi:tyrosinase